VQRSTIGWFAASAAFPRVLGVRLPTVGVPVAALGAVEVTAVGAARGRVAAGRDGVWGWLVRRGVPVTV
jgi:hypothetical protein